MRILAGASTQPVTIAETETGDAKSLFSRELAGGSIKVIAPIGLNAEQACIEVKTVSVTKAANVVLICFMRFRLLLKTNLRRTYSYVKCMYIIISMQKRYT